MNISPGITTLQKSLGIAIALLGAVLCALPAAAFQDDGTVRIGSIETQTGAAAPYGVQARNGSRMAVDEINAAGGVKVAGKMVKMSIVPEPNGYDDSDSTVQSLALFKKLVFDDQVLAVKGVTRSVSLETIFNYLKEIDKTGSGTVLLSPESSTPGLGGITPWGFRNAFFESSDIDHILSLVKDKFGYKTAAVFVVRDNPFNSSGWDNSYKELLEKHGIKVLTVVEGFEKIPSDFSREVGQLQSADADIVFMAASVQPGVGLMKEAARRGFKPKMWVGTLAQLSPETPRLAGAAAERMILPAAYSPASPDAKKLADSFKQRFGTDIAQYGITAYDAMYLIKKAIESSGIENRADTLQADRVKFRDALGKAEIDSGAGGKVAFGPNGDAISEGVILAIKDGKFVDWDGNAFP